MTLSLGTIPVQAWNGRGQTEQRTFPHKLPSGDPGAGGGGSETITVYKDGGYKLCWRNSGTPATIPPAFSANPTLTGTENWWPHGVHTFGRVTHSPNFGVIISKVVGLRRDGVIGHCHAAFWHKLDAVNLNEQGLSYRGGTWKQVGKTNYTGSAATPPEGGANSFHQHFGYDWYRRTDLANGTAAQLDLYTLSGNWYTGNGMFTLGSLLWQGTANHRDVLGYKLVDDTLGVSGFERICLGWLGHWWVLQFGQGTGDVQQIWGFNPSLSGESSAWAVPIPTNDGTGYSVVARMQAAGYPGNLTMCVDQTNQRIIAAQADVLGTSVLEGGRTKWPLKLWTVNPTTFVFTPITMSSTMYIVNPFKDSPLVWQGGNTFIYYDQRAPNGQGDYYWGTQVSGGLTGMYTGGYIMKEIFIPTGNETRTVTWTEKSTSGWAAVAGTGELPRQKHCEYAFRPTVGQVSDGRVWWHGGDLTGAAYTPYSQAMFSFDPENVSSSLIYEQQNAMTGKAVRPWKPDENGFAYRASSDDFWMLFGYNDGTPNGLQGTWVDVNEWTSVTGGVQKIWRMNATTKVWTTHTPTPATGFESYSWLVSSSRQLRWYYDSVVDAMVIAQFGGQGGTPAVTIVDCATITYKTYIANRLTGGGAGSATPASLPDGRPTNIPLTVFDDRAAIDPTNGALYVYDPIRGDLFRIMTRATPYIAGGNNNAQVEWCCKLPPTNQTRNASFLLVRNGVVWVFRSDATSRFRLFSWAIGEGAAQEHTVPYAAGIGAAFTYTVSGGTRFGVLGGAYVSGQMDPVRAAGWDKVHTAIISP